jgi:hypothetical protein
MNHFPSSYCLSFIFLFFVSRSTLDYVFVSKHWMVDEARVVPEVKTERVDSSQSDSQETSRDHQNGESCTNKGDQEHEHSEDCSKCNGEGEGDHKVPEFDWTTASIDTPQPTEEWPSDHLLLRVQLSL